MKDLKTCSKCKTEKETSKFSKNKSAKDGFDGWCKVCMGENQKMENDHTTSLLKNGENQKKERSLLQR